MNKLLELAERCEKAMGPDCELNTAIFAMIGKRYKFGFRLQFTASLDAALTLVPDGGGVNIDRYWTPDGEEWAVVITVGLGHKFAAEAKSGALALCAAALRARAAQ